jgi:hypothetical protein
MTEALKFKLRALSRGVLPSEAAARGTDMADTVEKSSPDARPFIGEEAERVSPLSAPVTSAPDVGPRASSSLEQNFPGSIESDILNMSSAQNKIYIAGADSQMSDFAKPSSAPTPQGRFRRTKTFKVQFSVPPGSPDHSTAPNPPSSSHLSAELQLPPGDECKGLPNHESSVSAQRRPALAASSIAAPPQHSHRGTSKITRAGLFSGRLDANYHVKEMARLDFVHATLLLGGIATAVR